MSPPTSSVLSLRYPFSTCPDPAQTCPLLSDHSQRCPCCGPRSPPSPPPSLFLSLAQAAWAMPTGPQRSTHRQRRVRALDRAGPVRRADGEGGDGRCCPPRQDGPEGPVSTSSSSSPQSKPKKPGHLPHQGAFSIRKCFGRATTIPATARPGLSVTWASGRMALPCPLQPRPRTTV